MLLLRVRLVGMGPFEDVEFPFADEDGRPRPVTLVQGGGGVGKTTLLAAIATTRPGYTIAQTSASGAADLDSEARLGAAEPEARAVQVVTEWTLGQDDPGRPHPLTLATPNARAFAEEERELLRRREQTLFDRVSRSGGFAFLAIPSSRWFARQPLSMTAPGRGVARYDVRAPASFDDASRSELGRETKQALAYAAIAAALSRDQPSKRQFLSLGRAMFEAVDVLVARAGYRYRGVDAASLEPVFATPSGRLISFDSLPTRARHLVSFAALPVRTLWGAYPGKDPREAEGLVLIDEVDLHLDATILSGLVAGLREALPNVQWVLTTATPAVAGIADTREVLALRRLPEQESVALFVGDAALTH